jgi:hypothetical protein
MKSWASLSDIAKITGDIYLWSKRSGEEVAIKVDSVKAKHQYESNLKVYKTLVGGVVVPFIK